MLREANKILQLLSLSILVLEEHSSGCGRYFAKHPICGNLGEYTFYLEYRTGIRMVLKLPIIALG